MADAARVENERGQRTAVAETLARMRCDSASALAMAFSEGSPTSSRSSARYRSVSSSSASRRSSARTAAWRSPKRGHRQLILLAQPGVLKASNRVLFTVPQEMCRRSTGATEYLPPIGWTFLMFSLFRALRQRRLGIGRCDEALKSPVERRCIPQWGCRTACARNCIRPEHGVMGNVVWNGFLADFGNFFCSSRR